MTEENFETVQKSSISTKMSTEIDPKSKSQSFYIPLSVNPPTDTFLDLLQNYSHIPRDSIPKHLEKVCKSVLPNAHIFHRLEWKGRGGIKWNIMGLWPWLLRGCKAVSYLAVAPFSMAITSRPKSNAGRYLIWKKAIMFHNSTPTPRRMCLEGSLESCDAWVSSIHSFFVLLFG